MLMAAVVTVVPDVLQLAEILGLLGGEPSGLLQYRLPHLLAPMLDTIIVDLQGFEQNILLGVHDGQKVFKAVPVVIGGVHMDMKPAGGVDLAASIPQGTDRSLE